MFSLRIIILNYYSGISSNINDINAKFDTKDVDTKNLLKTDKIQNISNFNKISLLLSPRNILKGNDEGPHQNMIFKMKEWWYYNVYLIDENSELKNWFILMSIRL